MWHLVFILLSTFLWTRMHRPQPQDCHWTWVMSHFRLAIRSHYFLLVLHNHTITSCNRLLFVVLSLRVFSWHFVSRGCACFSVRTVLHYVPKYSMFMYCQRELRFDARMPSQEPRGHRVHELHEPHTHCIPTRCRMTLQHKRTFINRALCPTEHWVNPCASLQMWLLCLNIFLTI